MSCGCGGLMPDCFCWEDEYGSPSKISNYQEDLNNKIKLLEHSRSQDAEIIAVLEEALSFYANRMSYSVDYDTSQMGTSRRVILYSDQEEINQATIIAGRRAREALLRVKELRKIK